MKMCTMAAALALSASVAEASDVTFTIKPLDSVASTYTGVAGSTGIYADVSSGDNGGLVAYYFTLNAGVVDTTKGSYNTAPFTIFGKSKADSRPAGFDFLRSSDTALQQSATQETTNSAIVPVYGYGQRVVDLTTYQPAGYSNASTGGIQPDPSLNPSNATLLLYAFVPLATFKGTTSASYFNTTGGTNGPNFGANVWTNTSSTTVVPATTILVGSVIDDFPGIAYDNNGVASSLGTSVGSLNIKSSGAGRYTDSPILTGLASTHGSVTLTTTDVAGNTNQLGLGGEVPVFILVNFNLGFQTLADLESGLPIVSGSDALAMFDSSTDPVDFNALQAQFGAALFPSASSLLFKTTVSHTGNAPSFGWDLNGIIGVSVNNIVAVPEPASLTLLTWGGVGLLARRRK